MTYLIALILFHFIIAFEFDGVHGRRTLAHQRPLISPMSHNGQVYDCVDFYKQPAFDHPILKNHVPKVRSNSETSIKERFNITEGGCPDGSVPILRQGEDPPPRPIRPRARVHCYAIVQTNTNRKYYGSSAQLSIYKPKAEGNQWSTGRIRLTNGNDSIDAGWMVYPAFFKDNEAHLYARFNAGPIECLNLNCPGFVQVDKEIALGDTPQMYSTIGGQQYVWYISVDKHTDDGNWYLSLTVNGSTHQIGYWPGNLFTSLNDAATKVDWGGEINDPGTVEPAPEMGSGLKADDYDLSTSASLQHVAVVDDTHNQAEPDGTEKLADCSELYTVRDWGSKGGSAYGRVIFYGGSQPPP